MATRSAPRSSRAAGSAGKGKPTPQRPSAGISRVDQPERRTHGYVVRLDYRRTKSGSYRPRLVSFFGDASHGGRKGAWEAAEKWRAQALRKQKSGGRAA